MLVYITSSASRTLIKKWFCALNKRESWLRGSAYSTQGRLSVIQVKDLEYMKAAQLIQESCWPQTLATGDYSFSQSGRDQFFSEQAYEYFGLRESLSLFECSIFHLQWAHQHELVCSYEWDCRDNNNRISRSLKLAGSLSQPTTTYSHFES